MSIHSQFLTYFKTEFFENNQEEFELFQKSLLRPLKKTIRLNSNRINFDSFISEKEKEGWKFHSTPNGHVFHVDRLDTSTALGSTLEHLRGDFYIQELSASMSVWQLSDGKVHPENHLILEMAASPGGKTTQLSEHYPNSIIVANEFAKERINALIENVERMGNTNVAITNVNGVQFENLENVFDLVLLDAPCSGEGIGFKAEQSLKFWNIKNVRTIARLQSKLLKAWLTALKPGGTLLYSTCTLNKIENGGVLESAKEAFGDAIDVVFHKRFWPHKETAGGFFIAKIVKKTPFEEQKTRSMASNPELSILVWRDLDAIKKSLDSLWAKLPGNTVLYRYKNDILLSNDHPYLPTLLRDIYAIRFGMRIGRYENGTFVPNHYLGANFVLGNVTRIDLSNEETDRYLSGMEIERSLPDSPFVQLFANGKTLSLSSLENGKIKNQFPRNWLRK